MCGIAGIYNISGQPVEMRILENMIKSLAHRGPDDTGFHVNGNIGLGQNRLSIIDLSGGRQPIYNEDRSICVIFNGEIFNYIELREHLVVKGHIFRTRSDTEVIVHSYEEYGKDFLSRLNGQFAIALWNGKSRELILARDRIGICPLFYSVPDGGTFLFGSEIKALFRHPLINPEIDPCGLDQIFTLWVNVPPRTAFKNVCELPPGHIMTVTKEGIKIRAYWKYQFPDMNDYEDRPLSYYTSKLKEKLYDAVTIRLRADVTVAAYLSGGLDSSIITSLVRKYHNNHLITFSVAFSDSDYDERIYQEEMIRHIDTDHRVIEADYGSIGNAFYDVVRFAEKPMIRTAPAPLYILSGLVRDNNIKVVLTGEGADEFFGGYNIFKEDKIRRFWAKYPDSRLRPVLLSNLYPYIDRSTRADSFWQVFFKRGLTDTGNKFYSHMIRWNNTSGIKRFFTDNYQKEFDENRVLLQVEEYTDPDMRRWHPLCMAQYLEALLFLPGYLLSSQGDRMMMGHAVEGRFPFLDHNVIEFAGTIPPKYKIKVLNEKYILKEAYKDILPESITTRDKQPYRSPIGKCFTENNTASSMLSPEKIKQYGYFKPESVRNLVNKISPEKTKTSERDDMTLAGIVSTQLLHHHFIEKP